MKESIEFRISTESHTLASEKELIRKIGEVDKELNEAIKVFKLKRKLVLIEGDIEQLKKEIEQEEASIVESNKRLDVLYSELRLLTRAPHRSADGRRQQRPRRPEFKEEQMSISLEDIAVIKKKNNKDSNKEKNDESN